MPGFDGTGPYGMGRRFGRGLGPCRNNQRIRRGFNRFGNRSNYAINDTTNEEKILLLKEELNEIEEEKKDLLERLKHYENK